MSEKINMEKFCDSISKDYAELLKNKLEEKEFEVVIKHINKKHKVLDLCCGTGRYLIPLTKLRYKIEGIDFSKGMINQAEAYAKKDKVNIKIEQGDATSINKKDSSYDVVLLLGDSLGSIPGRFNRQKALDESYRILKKNAILICMVGNRNANFKFFLQHIKQYISNLFNHNFVYGDRIYDFLGSKGIHHDYSKFEIEKSMRKSKFNIIDVVKGTDDLSHKIIYVCKK